MGRVDIEDHVTIAQFNKLRQSMEEKQDRLTQDLQNLMTEIRRRRQPHDGVSNHGDDGDMSDRSAASRSSREQGRRNQGRGRGQGRRNHDDDESKKEDDDNHSQYRYGR